MRYLGIVYGTGKVGIALSDEAGTMGFPHDTFPNDERLVERVRMLAADKDVGVIIIGESRDFSGKENPVALEAKVFGTRLRDETGLAVFYELEMLSTQEARRGPDGMHPQHAGDSSRQRSVKGNEAALKGGVDASAAALILTSYLSHAHD